jgi:hypothetical protein
MKTQAANQAMMQAQQNKRLQPNTQPNLQQPNQQPNMQGLANILSQARQQQPQSNMVRSIMGSQSAPPPKNVNMQQAFTDVEERRRIKEDPSQQPKNPILPPRLTQPGGPGPINRIMPPSPPISRGIPSSKRDAIQSLLRKRYGFR